MRTPTRSTAGIPPKRNCRQPEERNVHANIRKLLMAAAVIVVAPPAFANVITDWNENAVTFVTPRMAPGAGQRVVAIMQVASGQFDRTPLSAVSRSAAGGSDHVEGGRCDCGGWHCLGEPYSAGAGTSEGHDDILSRLDSGQRREGGGDQAR
jgi:hypothetical protein